MYKKVSIKKLGRKTSHREALILNQLRTLFENGKLNTTVQKAKATKARAESIISGVKKDDNNLAFRRSLQQTFGNTELVKKVYEYAKKEGSAVTMVKVGFRAGDNALMARVDLMGYKGKPVKKAVKKSEEKEVKEEKVVETKETLKGIEKLGKKRITKQAGTATKTRARSRSGL